MLYIVSTPIGNLADITYRAVGVLNNVDLILCEDTRHTLVLLNKYNIKKPLKKYERFSERRQLDEITQMLRKGKNIALVSDAGTPLISDPGGILVERLKAEGLEYTAVGGQCAAINGLVLSGFDASAFCFAGFLPEKNTDRKRLIERFSAVRATLVFYVSPHSLAEDIAFLAENLGARKACLVREISKLYEEHIDFTLTYFPPDITARGEMVLVVEGATEGGELTGLTVEEHYAHYISASMSEKDAMKLTAKERGIAKSEVYAAVKVKPNTK